jgi:hypothetical protein
MGRSAILRIYFQMIAAQCASAFFLIPKVLMNLQQNAKNSKWILDTSQSTMWRR